MRPEVRTWVEGIVAEYRPEAPVLEVGARNINGTCRDLFPQDGYIGLDLQTGDGVNVVADITEPLRIYYYQFGTILCLETLEHVTRPDRALFHIYDCLRSGGLLIATWVFKFPIHNEPDYWRVTPAGFRFLLEDTSFTDIRIDTEGEGPVGVFAVARKP